MRYDSVKRGGHAFLAALLVLFSHPALAATIVVDETTCTLVDAITAANTDTAAGGCPAGSGPDTIELTTDVTLVAVNNYAFYGDNGLPQVSSDITVDGGGFTIERDVGAPAFRFFMVVSSATITLNDVTLRNGAAMKGGAIYNDLSTVILADSTVSGNSADTGGGIFTLYGTTTLTNSTVSENTAVSRGGGIRAFDAPITLTNSTVSGNSAGTGGGGMFSHQGTTTLTNSTVSGNSAAGQGGALYNDYGEVYVTHSTVSGNSAAVGGGIFDYPSPGHPVVVANSIVADNSNGNCESPVFFDIVDNGNNFADDGTCGGGFAAITPGADFDSTLADNGGPTLTHALLLGSVAIDAAGACGLATDQRGVPRSRAVSS